MLSVVVRGYSPPPGRRAPSLLHAIVRREMLTRIESELPGLPTEELVFAPTYEGFSLRGGILIHRQERWAFLAVGEEDSGVYSAVVDEMNQRGLSILCHRESIPILYTHGYWGEIPYGTEYFLLKPPLSHPEVIQTACFCLTDQSHRFGLLGTRVTGAAVEKIAWPGGGVEPGEALEFAALRELLEETGVDAHHLPRRLLGHLHVYSPVKERVNRITYFHGVTDSVPSFSSTSELLPDWFELEGMKHRRQLAAPARHALRLITES